ncbi:MAG: glycosyltransferase family 2 protein [Bacteroidales bacterium]
MSFCSDQIWVAIPAMDERDWLPATIASLAEQTVQDFNVIVCVNQPDVWWRDPLKKGICERNMETLGALQADIDRVPFRLHIIDHCSPGKGWPEGRGGAGMARRTAMDEAFRTGGEHSVIVSTDADTVFDPGYLDDIVVRMNSRPDALAIASPYYHHLTGQEPVDRAVIRYELYMRSYLLNLLRIKSPYAFTAIGSAMALTGKGYRKTGGVPLLQGGEDFYLLQKVAKAGNILNWIPSRVYPAARASARVAFGTGPAIEAGINGDWSAYPVIHPRHLEPLARWYEMIPDLFFQDRPTPIDSYLLEQFGYTGIWQSIRQNCASLHTFKKAVHQKIDGLRTWQMLRKSMADESDDAAILANVELFLPDSACLIKNGFEASPLSDLATLRDRMFGLEMQMRKESDEKI